MDKNKTPERIINYEPIAESAKVSVFVKRIGEQIRVLQIGITNGSVNDPEKAKNYASKAERFLVSPVVARCIKPDRTVRELKKRLKIETGLRKELAELLNTLIDWKIDNKIIVAQNHAPFKAGKEIPTDTYVSNLFLYDQNLFEVFLTKAEAERLLINKLIGLLADSHFVLETGCKNAWKVSNLKAAIALYQEDMGDERVGDDIAQILLLPYFKYKRFTDLTVAELKERLAIRTTILDGITGWVKQKQDAVNTAYDNFKSKSPAERRMDIYGLLRVFDQLIFQAKEEKRRVEDEYSLYRFGQGLIENDIFDSLYK